MLNSLFVLVECVIIHIILISVRNCLSFLFFHLLLSAVVSEISYNKVYLEGVTINLQIHVPDSSLSSSSMTTPQTLLYTWRKDGRLVTESSKYSTQLRSLPGGASIIGLDVSDVQNGDSGVYSCEVSNAVSAKTVTFERVGVVNVAVSSSVEARPGEVLSSGRNASLLCRAAFTNIPSSYEDLSVAMWWERPGYISLGKHVHASNSSMISSGMSHRIYGSYLRFSPAMRGDGGKYVCTVKYRVGSGGEVIVRHHDDSLDIDSKIFLFLFILYLELDIQYLVDQTRPLLHSSPSRIVAFRCLQTSEIVATLDVWPHATTVFLCRQPLQCGIRSRKVVLASISTSV